MATPAGGYTRGARDLDFNTGNAAMDAFQQGQKIAREEETHVEDIQTKRLKNEQDKLANPHRLRTIEAESRSKVVGANVDEATQADKIAQEGRIKTQQQQGQANSSTAKGAVDTASVGSDIERRQADARGATYDTQYKGNTLGSRTRLSEANAQQNEAKAATDTATVPDVISNSNVQAGINRATAPDKIATSGAAARTAVVNDTVNTATAQDRVDTSNAGAQVAVGTVGSRIRTADANVKVAEMQPFEKLLGHLKAGDIEAAQEMSRLIGEPIPEVLLTSADARRHYVGAGERALKAYPNSPAKQQEYIKLYLEGVRVQREQMSAGGVVPNNPQAVTSTPGAPAPQEAILGAGGTQSVYQQKLAVGNALYGEGTQAAADYANGRRQLSEPEMRKFAISEAARTEKYNATRRKALEEQIFQSLRTSGQLPAAAAPTPAPAVAPPPARPAAPQAAPPAAQPSRQPSTAAPPIPPGLPPGSQYSPSRNMWRTPDGKIYGPDGKPAGQSAAPGPASVDLQFLQEGGRGAAALNGIRG